MSFRPTLAQALGGGAFLGLLIGFALAVLGSVLAGTGLASRLGVPGLLAVLVPVVLGPVGGALGGLAFGRRIGADVDDRGVQLVPRRLDGFVPWPRVVDLRVERRGWRNQVALWLDSGAMVRLPAPYHGSLLAADPEFERKLFMLRNLWENHRSFNIH